MPEWDAEVEIDHALVRALLGERSSELDAASARLLGAGTTRSGSWRSRAPLSTSLERECRDGLERTLIDWD